MQGGPKHPDFLLPECPRPQQKDSTPWAPFHKIHIQRAIFFFLEPLVGSGEWVQATRHSSKSSTRYEDSVQQLLAVICARCNFSSLPLIWEDGGLQGCACSIPLPEIHLDGEKVGSCGLVGGELVKQGRGSGGFSGEGSA